MGGGSWSTEKYAGYASSVSALPKENIFRSRSLVEDLNPASMKAGRREARDSADHPNSTPIAIFTDVTGSMGHTAEIVVKTGLGIIMDSLLTRLPVPDPALCIGAIGDNHSDNAPFQVGQFEASNILPTLVEKIYLEGNGGPYGQESYINAWYWAARHVDADAFTKGRKGYLFTIGDESTYESLTAAEIKKIFGNETQPDPTYSAKQLLLECQRNWHVFHLLVKTDTFLPQWKVLLGQHVLVVDDIQKLAEVIVSAIQIVEGHDAAAVAASWDGSTALTVASATRGLTAHSKTGPAGLVVTP